MLLADVLKLEPDDVRLNESFDRYGLESLTALEIRNRLDADIPGLPATLLFEHNTLARLAAWLAENHADSIARLFPDDSSSSSGPRASGSLMIRASRRLAVRKSTRPSVDRALPARSWI